jgi:hypothetical protein
MDAMIQRPKLVAYPLANWGMDSEEQEAKPAALPVFVILFGVTRSNQGGFYTLTKHD